MTITSTEIIAIIVALGAVIVNIIVAFRTGGKVDSIAQVTAKSLVETTALQGQVREVHTLTNSNLSQVRSELQQGAAEIASLREVINDLKLERDKTALATAFNTPTAPSGPRPIRATDAAQPPIPVKVITEEPIPVDVQEPKTKPKPKSD